MVPSGTVWPVECRTSTMLIRIASKSLSKWPVVSSLPRANCHIFGKNTEEPFSNSCQWFIWVSKEWSSESGVFCSLINEKIKSIFLTAKCCNACYTDAHQKGGRFCTS